MAKTLFDTLLHILRRFGKAFLGVRILRERDREIIKLAKKERPISLVYPVIDNDLARDNLENDLPAADLEDL